MKPQCGNIKACSKAVTLGQYVVELTLSRSYVIVLSSCGEIVTLKFCPHHDADTYHSQLNPTRVISQHFLIHINK